MRVGEICRQGQSVFRWLSGLPSTAELRLELNGALRIGTARQAMSELIAMGVESCSSTDDSEIANTSDGVWSVAFIHALMAERDRLQRGKLWFAGVIGVAAGFVIARATLKGI